MDGFRTVQKTPHAAKKHITLNLVSKKNNKQTSNKQKQKMKSLEKEREREEDNIE